MHNRSLSRELSLISLGLIKDKGDFKLNKLYTTVMIGVSFATFMFITYGLSSSITTVN